MEDRPDLRNVSADQLKSLQDEAIRERCRREERAAEDTVYGGAQCETASSSSTRTDEPLSLANIEDCFTFHPWNLDKIERGKQVVEVLVAAAKVILRVVPAGPDRTVALRKLREARMDANSAITHGGRF